jgi:hypothetical protein
MVSATVRPSSKAIADNSSAVAGLLATAAAKTA